MLNVFYSWKVTEAPFLWNLLKKQEKLSNYCKRDKLTVAIIIAIIWLWQSWNEQGKFTSKDAVTVMEIP